MHAAAADNDDGDKDANDDDDDHTGRRTRSSAGKRQRQQQQQQRQQQERHHKELQWQQQQEQQRQNSKRNSNNHRKIIYLAPSGLRGPRGVPQRPPPKRGRGRAALEGSAVRRARRHTHHEPLRALVRRRGSCGNLGRQIRQHRRDARGAPPMRRHWSAWGIALSTTTRSSDGGTCATRRARPCQHCFARQRMGRRSPGHQDLQQGGRTGMGG